MVICRCTSPFHGMHHLDYVTRYVTRHVTRFRSEGVVIGHKVDTRLFGSRSP
jgi:hypothetical protein